MISAVRFLIAVALVLTAAVIGILGSVPGAANGATLLALLLIAAGLVVGFYVPRSRLADDPLKDGER